MRILRSGALLLICGLVAAQENAVPVEQEPHHHLVLRNGSVIVTHVTLAPGESTLYHTHSYDRVAVHLSDGPVTLQEQGQAESAPLPSQIGEISASTRKKDPLTHRVHNVGTVPFEVMDVEILKPSKGNSKPIAAVAAENPSARVYQWTLVPGAATEQHTHKRPYLIMAVTAMTLKMTAPDGQTSTLDIAPGDVHWVDAKITHTLANGGTTEGQIVEIELK